MDEHHQLTADADARRREVWADSLGDVLASACLEEAEAERAVGRLVQAAVSDTEYAVRESALHAVCEAGVHYALPYVVLEPLAFHIDAFEPLLLEYVLFSLSATHDRRALRPVEPFLSHPDSGVRGEAERAVAELRACGARSSPPCGAA
ncbi:hypothetical protein OG302_03680 [Streptomyces sp. NBC_01283]|uniref:hypothetical protein n=1 Tax=Streptomyces sp. NBC_01283 TaxID=2903812 RepID=UPI00352EC93C|nr:hypothetical protein OG302_03680 [Streptomyces sp. NBC_01283]